MKIKDQIAEAEALDADTKQLEDEVAKMKAQSAAMWHEIWEHMDGEELENVRVKGTNYGPKTSRFGVIQDQSAFIKWAMAHKPELIQPKPRQKLINEEVNRRLDDGQPLPDGLGYYEKPWVSRRSG